MKNDIYLLAIDAGTGSVRAVIFDTLGNQIECISKEWEHLNDPRYPGSMNFDWEKNWKLTTSAIKEVLEKSKIDSSNIKAISTTCMREAIVLYDKNGKEIWACANVDARSDNEVKQLKKNKDLEVELYKETGETFPLSAIPRLLWVKNNEPEIYKNIAHIGMINDWIIYKMSGTLKVDPSNGSTSGFFNLKNRIWDKSIAKRCNLRSDIFPEVSECGQIVSRVNQETAILTSLKKDTPIVTGGGDAQLGSIGVGIVKKDQAAIFGGSFWQYEYNTEDPIVSEKSPVRVNCHAIPNIWQYEALAFIPGLIMRWYRDAFCELDVKVAKENKLDFYYMMDQKAKDIPAGSYGMMCTFSNIMNFLSWKHAAPSFTNFAIDSKKYNKYTFYRAILENTAFITYGHVQLIKEVTNKEIKSVIFAGGASKSPLWAQILCDVLAIPLSVPVVKEATALGSAILAGVGIGIYKNLAEASKKIVKLEKTYIPNMDNHKVYMNLYKKWLKIYENQLTLSDADIERYMWKAPGI
ncbi:MAG: autoinducer-2 kinase [Sphaerochaetaceae bacterium]|nr:autoinducer-2 kinase [Sphaerochaetaceae bacterium]